LATGGQINEDCLTNSAMPLEPVPQSGAAHDTGGPVLVRTPVDRRLDSMALGLKQKPDCAATFDKIIELHPDVEEALVPIGLVNDKRENCCSQFR
jgi:hypothetical protein